MGKVSIKRVALASVIPAVLAVVCMTCLGQKSESGRPSQELAKAQVELSYLRDVPEIAWHTVKDDEVYIGFSSRPDDWQTIIAAAARKGAKAVNGVYMAWAVDATKWGREWTPSDDSKCIGYAISRRDGQVTDTSWNTN